MEVFVPFPNYFESGCLLYHLVFVACGEMSLQEGSTTFRLCFLIETVSLTFNPDPTYCPHQEPFSQIAHGRYQFCTNFALYVSSFLEWRHNTPPRETYSKSYLAKTNCDRQSESSFLLSGTKFLSTFDEVSHPVIMISISLLNSQQPGKALKQK
ncbi:uncharacterized protein PHALS_05363 [Plasmopara halstedii]|uniref:Uncharacterized protein n=1 Tax=Plasmopara halstedii TaxID=4781 RepID=A0A0P1ABB0_PLAHL|nr:uncharacterized protein PHALS_05363 [Plasmopara halstedii]CEG37584.1 hypothetical protein PHALS_05363 [Plasmopara halstedii]|eukprot:XP_024573953.1 hypothetical protein PHALS_05363 [Plasmopara halstedii]